MGVLGEEGEAVLDLDVCGDYCGERGLELAGVGEVAGLPKTAQALHLL